MMKAGIMTWHEYYNYGTSLQVTAMSSLLKQIGLDPFLINYRARRKGEDGEIKPSLATKVKRKIINIKNKPFSTAERTGLFQSFLKKHIKYTDKCYTLAELEGLNSKIDIFVCGSDQIWAPSVFDPHYYLDFVSDSNKTIAYAPSVGLPAIKNEYVREAIKVNASRVKYISTREKSGSKIISDIIGRHVDTVLDPTLMITAEQWRQFFTQSQEKKNPYILVYMLGSNHSHWAFIKKISKYLDLDCKIIPVFTSDLKKKECISNAIGPEEFLKLVNEASFVCTDSYHGTLFSVLFEKNFCVFERFKEDCEDNQNSRIYDILEKLELSNRICRTKNDIEAILNSQVNYKSVGDLLKQQREISISFLINSVNDIKDYLALPKTRVLNNIKLDLTLCCGCGSCKKVCPTEAISIIRNQEGFYVSKVDNDRCVSCGKCRSVCPYLNLSSRMCDAGQLYSFKDYSYDTLMTSSSGGAAYEIAKLGIKNGYTVYGCTFEQKSQVAKHVRITDTESLSSIQGSKYMQSDFSDVFKTLRNEEKAIVFGTPCQIAAVKTGENNENILLVDLVCHGVPSYYLLSSYKDYLERKYGLSGSLDIRFRYKPKGWRYIYIYTADTNRSICTHQSEDPYFLLFEHGLCYSKNCFECPWRDRSAADIRLGDYWGDRFKKDNTGVSMLLVMTEKGHEWVDLIRRQNLGDICETPITDYTTVQQMCNSGEPLYRKQIIDRLGKNDPIETIIDEYVVPLEKERKLNDMIGRIRKLL